MDCVLFRHGIAVDREDWEGADAERPLTPKGVHRTRQASAGLRKLDIAPGILLSSPFTRAFETAQLLREGLRISQDIQLCDELLPDSPPDKLLVLLNTFPPDVCVVCVGHEPHLSDAAGLMLFGQPINRLYLKKAGAAFIRFDAAPRQAQGTLEWWLTPSQVRGLR